MGKFSEYPKGLEFLSSEALVAILFVIWSEVILLLELSMLFQVQWCTSVSDTLDSLYNLGDALDTLYMKKHSYCRYFQHLRFFKVTACKH